MKTFTTQRYYRIAAGVFYFIMGLTFATWASRIPDIKRQLGLNEAGLGSVLFFIPMGQLSAMAFSGYLVSRFSSRKVLSFAAFLYPTALLGLGAASTVWQLSLGLYLFGVSANLCSISVNTQGVGVERLYRRSIMASFHGIWSIAGFTGGVISTLMVGLNIPPFWHFCLIYILVISLVILVRGSILPRDAVHKNVDRKTFRIPEKYVLILGFIAFGSMICEGTMFDWSSVYFEKIIAPAKELIRLGYVAYMFAMASGRFTADWLVTRFGVTRILQTSGIIIATGLFISVIFPHLITATIGFLLVGIGTSSVVPMCFSLAGKSKTVHPGLAVTTVTSIGFLGFLIGPPLIGFIAQSTSLRYSFGFVAILGLATTILARKVKPVQA